MSISSQQPTLSTISLDDLQDIDLSSLTTTSSAYSADTITLTSGGSAYTYTSYDSSMNSGISTISISGGGSGFSVGNAGASFSTANISSINSINISSLDHILNPTEWTNGFPDWDRVQKMCDTYPGLKIAFEKFKTTYKLVKDDYDNPDTKK